MIRFFQAVPSSASLRLHRRDLADGRGAPAQRSHATAAIEIPARERTQVSRPKPSETSCSPRARRPHGRSACRRGRRRQRPASSREQGRVSVRFASLSALLHGTSRVTAGRNRPPRRTCSSPPAGRERVRVRQPDAYASRPKRREPRGRRRRPVRRSDGKSPKD